MRIVADRIARSPGCSTNSSALGMNCRAIGSSDRRRRSARNLRRHRDRVAGSDPFEVGKPRGRRKAASISSRGWRKVAANLGSILSCLTCRRRPHH